MLESGFNLWSPSLPRCGDSTLPIDCAKIADIFSPGDSERCATISNCFRCMHCSFCCLAYLCSTAYYSVCLVESEAGKERGPGCRVERHRCNRQVEEDYGCEHSLNTCQIFLVEYPLKGPKLCYMLDSQSDRWYALQIMSNLAAASSRIT